MKRNIKKMIIRIVVAATAMLLAATLCSCGNISGNTSSDRQNAKIFAITSIFPQYDFIRAIAGETFGVRVFAEMLVSPGAESHTFTPTLSDMAAIEKANLIVLAGGEIDSWATDEILDVMPSAGKNVIYMIDLVETIEEEHDHEGGHEEHEETEADEHVWTSISNSIIIIREIAGQMCELDPDYSETYMKNASEYIEKLEKLDGEYRNLTENSKSRTLIFADRYPFAYFERDYGLDHVSALKGCSSVSEPPLSKVYEVYEAVKNEKAGAVLTVEFSDGILAETIARECKIPHLEFHSCHNVTKSQFENGETCLSIMTKNLEVVKEALNG